MGEPSEFSRAVIAAAQGNKKPKLQKRVAKLLDAGYKPTDEDLPALIYYFRYEKRGRPRLINNPVQKIVHEIRDYCRRTGLTQAEAFEWLKLTSQLRGYEPEEFEDFREKVLTELRRSRRSKK
jgi:hypothetical protein